KVLEGSKIARGRKNLTNIRKQVVRKPAMLYQTIRRRVLFTGGSGVDSTTTAGGFAGAGFAGTFAAGGTAGPAGDSATATDVSLLGPLSTPEPPHSKNA